MQEKKDLAVSKPLTIFFFFFFAIDKSVLSTTHFVLRPMIKRRLGSDTRELLRGTGLLQLWLAPVLHLFPNQSLQPWLW